MQTRNFNTRPFLSFAKGIFIGVATCTIALILGTAILFLLSWLTPTSYFFPPDYPPEKSDWDKLFLNALILSIVYSLYRSTFILKNLVSKKKKKKYNKDKEDKGYVSPELAKQIFLSVIIVFSVMCIVLAFPIMIIYWTGNSTNYKKSIQIGLTVLSIGISIIYYINNKEKLPSVADKVGFFGGVVLGPPGLIEFIL